MVWENTTTIKLIVSTKTFSEKERQAQGVYEILKFDLKQIF